MQSSSEYEVVPFRKATDRFRFRQVTIDVKAGQPWEDGADSGDCIRYQTSLLRVADRKLQSFYWAKRGGGYRI